MVQRIDDGAKLADSLSSLIQERAELELKYAKSLKAWSRKWEDTTNKGWKMLNWKDGGENDPEY